MNNYIVIIKNSSNMVYSIQIKALNFSDAERQALLFPTITNVLQITLYN